MRINEIFYSLQGEGFFTGCPATFVRFSGCNLKCPFCDTNHRHFTEMTEDEIVEEVKKNKTYLVVMTGGEPSLQLTQSLVDKLRALGKIVAVETNGTRELPQNVFITLSPKSMFVGERGNVIIPYADEIKIVYDGKHEFESFGVWFSHFISAQEYFLQPMDTGDEEKNKEIINSCVEYIKEHPQWRLSLQTQKILNIR